MTAVNRTIGSGIQLKNTVHFRSIGRAGTGSNETIAHGLGITPAYVELQTRASTTAYTIVSFDNKNLVVNVANAAVYDLLAYPSGE